MNKLILLPILAFSMIFSPVLLAHEGSSCPCIMKEKMMQELKLTPEQRAKIKELKAQTRASMKANHEAMRDIRMKMRQLTQSEKMDEHKLNMLIEKKKELVASKWKSKITLKNKIYNILQPQQKAKYSAMVSRLEKKNAGKMDPVESDD